MAEATIGVQGRSEAVVLYDISERGCHAATEASISSGQRVEITLPRFSIRIAGTVVDQSEDGLHITFLGDGLAAAEADRISLTTVGELMQKAKDDHSAFVKRVVDIVAAGEKLPPDSLASPHHCRFGRWFDNVSDGPAMALASFKAIRKPHEAVHEFGRRTLIALGADDTAGTQRHVAEMRKQSEEVIRCLDALARDYPKTFVEEAA